MSLKVVLAVMNSALVADGPSAPEDLIRSEGLHAELVKTRCEE
jgi:hypothetical protein